MRVSLKWLQEFVDVDVPVEKLAERLSFSGTKVETIRRPGRDIEGVVVAEVLEINEHPNADNLILVDVQTGGGESERVVCGARNFAVGDRVPYATVGAHLPDLEITERKIRGEVSRGMLCSGAELGVSKDHSGIMVLALDSTLGEDVVHLLGLDDVILELEITPNRPDCLGVLGIAREVAALLGNELRVPKVELTPDPTVDARVEVRIEDPRSCPRYVARYIAGVKIAPSPTWMATRLLMAGVRPISNIVDVTNYVLFELGQPLHAFDASKVTDHRIIVRRAHDRERITTLDGVDRALRTDDLLIADPSRALAIAGVMGGEDSEVSDQTTDIILESAYFEPTSVAFAARRHLLWSEASARFERGTDPEIPPFAAARAAALMAELAGGRVAPQEVDEYPNPIARRTIELRPQRTNALLGIEISTERQASLLRSIQLKVEEVEQRLRIEAPSFRVDLKGEIDLVEEVARLAGLEALPSTLPPGRLGGLEPEQRFERHVRRVLVGMGMFEAWTRSFSSPAELDRLDLAPDNVARQMVTIANPTTEREAAVRTTLIPGLMGAAERNFAQGARGLALFELARVYEPTDEGLPVEALVLTAVTGGERRPKAWTGAEQRWEFFGLKGVLESALEALRFDAPTFAPAEGMPFHPTRCSSVSVGGVALGVLGEIHPEIAARFDLPSGTSMFEIAVAPLIAALPGRPSADELPRFPAIYIDIAVVVARDAEAATVREIIEEVGGPEATSVRLFDVYEGDQVPSGKKSLAFALELRDPTRTLTDEDASAVRDRIVAALVERAGGALRS